MKTRFIAVIVSIALAGGYFVIRYGDPSRVEQSSGVIFPDMTQTASDASVSAAPKAAGASTAANYDECITEGNSPLPDAPDKCLTKDGHLFIQGVVE